MVSSILINQFLHQESCDTWESLLRLLLLTIPKHVAVP
jgi:hypothetical protein